VLVSVCAILLCFSGAQGNEDTGGEPGAFLRLGVGARLRAMGGAGAGLVGEPWQLALNPSATIYSAGKGAVATHGMLFVDTDFQAISYLHPIWRLGTVAAGVLNLRSTGFERRGPDDDDYTEPGPSFDVRHSAFAAGLSREFSAWGVSGGLGIGLKAIQESVDEERGTSVYLDASATYRPVLPYLHRYLTPLSLNLTGRNLVGSSAALAASHVRYPTSVVAGAAYQLRPLRLTAVTDAEWIEEHGSRWRFGLELWPVDELALRGGRGGNEWTAGLGVVYKPFRLDYAFGWHEYLEDTHQVSLAVWLDSSLGPAALEDRARRDGRVGLGQEAAAKRLRLVCASPWATEAPGAAYHAAEELAKHGRKGGAAQLHRFLLGEHYPTPWAAKGLLWLGDAAYSEARYEGAVRRYEELLDHPHGAELDTWGMRFNLASSHDELRHWERAVAEYRRVLELAPQGSERKAALWRSGAILFDPLRRYAEALPVLEEIVRKYPSDDLRDPYFHLGMCCVYTEEWQKGLQAFRAFTERYRNEPRFAEATYRSGRCLYEMTRFREALVALGVVVSQYPSDPYADNALTLTGSAREALGEYQEALVEYGRVLKDYPEGDAAPAAMAGVARAYTYLGMADLAEQELQRLFRYYPDSEAADKLGGP
jgi:TolA-binding protein